jgi:hypothetical protein
VSSLLGDLGGIAANTVGETVAFAAGRAGSETLSPIAEAVAQKAWQTAPIRAFDPALAAKIVAQRIENSDWGVAEAARGGISSERFADLLEEAYAAVGFAELLEMKRRGTITDDDFDHGLDKLAVEDQYRPGLTDLENAKLLPAAIALGIVRSTIADPGLLTVTLDTGDSNIPKYPVASFDAIAEAAAAGIDEDRLRVLVGSVGLPMSAQQAASAYFRAILTLGAFNQAILEGDTRPEWAAAILDQARQIPTAHDYIESHLRTWIDQDAMYAGTALHGMSEPDTDLLFNVAGRPLPPHQITRGLARGGSYNGPTDQIPEAYLKAIAESNVRPEYYELDFLANEYTWPSYFVLKPLTAAGTITVDQATAIFEWSGWEPTLAAQTAASFVGSTSAAKQPTEAQLATQYEAGQIDRPTYVSDLEARGYSADNAEKVASATDAKPLISARTAILTKLRNGVVAGGITAEQATEELAKTTVAPATIPQLVAAWQHEYEIEHPSTAPTA